MVCDQVSRLHRNDPAILFVAMTHDLGKALTPKELLPKHHNYEKNGLLPLNNLIKRLNPPKEAEMLAKKVCELHLKSHRIFESRPGTVLKLLEALDAFRHPQRFENFLIAYEADKKGRLGLENDSYNQANFLRNVFKDCKKVSGKQFIEKGITGKKVGDAIRVKRLEQIKIFKNEWESKMLKQDKVFKL